jgi:hypothetical protein
MIIADVIRALMSWAPMIIILSVFAMYNRGATLRTNRALAANEENNQTMREIAESLKLIAKLLEDRKP